MEPFEFVTPTTVEEALDHLRDEGAIPLGGGTATVLMMKQNLLSPAKVVWLGRIAPLKAIEQLPDGTLVLGAMATLSDLIAAPSVGHLYPVLAETARHIGNPRVRAVASLGGNLLHADPSQDLPPVLLTLGAEMVIATDSGEQVEPLTPSFFVDYMQTAIQPGAVLKALRLPPPPPGLRAAYRKFTPRSQDDFATVGVAAAVERSADGTVRSARLALSGVGPTPIWVEAAAGWTGIRPSAQDIAELADAAAAAADPWDDLRGSAEYKRAMARVFTRRVLEEVLR